MKKLVILIFNLMGIVTTILLVGAGAAFVFGLSPMSVLGAVALVLLVLALFGW